MGKKKKRQPVNDGVENARSQQDLGDTVRISKGARKPKNTTK